MCVSVLCPDQRQASCVQVVIEIFVCNRLAVGKDDYGIDAMNEPKSKAGKELRRIIRELESIARDCETRGDSGQGGHELLQPPVKSGESNPGYSDQVLAEKAAQIYTTRRQRDRRVGQGFFGEPAWDILLDLFIHHVQDKSVSVTSACLASASPPTTGLRWLGVLEQAGFVMRAPDPEDGRVTLVRLTDHGLQVLREILGNYVAAVHDARLIA